MLATPGAPASPSTPPSAPLPTAIEIVLQARATTSISRRRSAPTWPARCASIRNLVKEQGVGEIPVAVGAVWDGGAAAGMGDGGRETRAVLSPTRRPVAPAAP